MQKKIIEGVVIFVGIALVVAIPFGVSTYFIIKVVSSNFREMLSGHEIHRVLSDRCLTNAGVGDWTILFEKNESTQGLFTCGPLEEKK